MKVRLIARLLLLAPLLVGTMATAQNLYKWVDDNGRVTYSDQPPPGKVKSQEVVKTVGSANAGAARQIDDLLQAWAARALRDHDALDRLGGAQGFGDGMDAAE